MKRVAFVLAIALVLVSCATMRPPAPLAALEGR
jgi:PBP1b-binding outer membrane lipoprotein LpoB